MVYVYVNNDTHSDHELSKSKQSIDADIDKSVLENKHFRMVINAIIIRLNWKLNDNTSIDCFIIFH